MRILGVGTRAYLGDIYLNLMREGHDVRVYAADPARSFRGLIDTVEDWRTELGWVGRDGVIMFETVGQGALQDELRADGYRVVGGSAFGDRLEQDRAYGQSLLERAGLKVAGIRPFASPEHAATWLRANPGRYVLKHDDNAGPTFVGAHAAGADMLHMLGRRYGPVGLMDYLDGVEVGIGGYFDGRRFLEPACIDFEHKRFFPGDLGEMTGEMGTLAAYAGSERLFAAALAPMAPALEAAGHVGYVNVNLIVNEQGIWPLEFTCRFGNPGFAVLAPLQLDGWGDLLGRMAGLVEGTGFRTSPDWCVAIVLTTPPFPLHLEAAPSTDDRPIFFHAPCDPAFTHLIDVRHTGGQLYVRAVSGHVMVVTGTGATVEAAQAAALQRARNVITPAIRWRNDIGHRFLQADRARLRQLGWLA